MLIFIPGAQGQEETARTRIPAALDNIGNLPLSDIRVKPSPSAFQAGSIGLPAKSNGARADIRVAELKGQATRAYLPHLNIGAWVENPLKKRDWESMPIGDRTGEQAVKLLAARPGEIMAGIRASISPADNLCSQAADRMNGSRKAMDYLAGYLDGASLTAGERILIEQFARYCFSSPFDGHTTPDIAEIASRAAILEVDPANEDGKVPSTPQYCSALFIDSARVVTARHCLFEDGIRINTAWTKVIPIGPQVSSLKRISPRIDPTYQIKNDDYEWKKNVAEDFVVLNVDAVPFQISPLAFASEEDLNSATGFVQVGYQHVMSLLNRQSPRTLEDFRAAYRLDDSKYCLAIHVSATCLVQGCQSVPQTSGAAFLVRRGGTIKLAATLYGASGGLSPEVKGCFPADADREAARSINVSSRAR